MNKTLLTIALLSGIICSYGQNPLTVGKGQLNTGLGLSNWGIPVYLGFDYGLTRDFTFGGEYSFRSYRDNYDGSSYHHTIVGISGSGNYHFNTILNLSSEWDFYAGLNLGIYAWSSLADYHGNHTSGLGAGAQVGGRYYLNQKVGLNLELGGGNAFSGIKFGLTFKL
jgi:hypothetical protein